MAPIITPAQTASAEEIRLLIHALRKTCLFQHASESDLFKLAMDMERVAFSPGDTLGPVEGQPQTHLFVVTAGRCVRHSAGHLVDERYYNHDLFPGTTAPWLVEQQQGGGSNSDGKTSASAHKLLAAGGTSGDASASSSSQQQSVVVRAVSASENKYGFTKNKSTVDIMCPDRPGLVAHVAAALRAQGLSIERSTLKTTHTQPRKKSIRTSAGLLARVWPGGGTSHDGNGASADGDGENGGDNTAAVDVEEGEVEQLQHTAYQNHEVVDATTNEPVTDPARMRRVEAAVLWALQKSVLPGTGRHGTVLQSRSSSDLAAAQAMQQGGEGSNNESSAMVEGSNGKAAAVKSIVPNGSYMTSSSSVGGYGGVNSFGTLQCLGELPSFATTTAVTSGVCWRLSSRALEDAIRGRGGGSAAAEDQDHQGGSSSTTSALASRQQIKAQQPSFNVEDKNKQRDLAVDIASGLAAEVFRMSNSYSTPLFDQPAQKVNVAAVSVAAAFESYYRSALNSFLNASISSAMTNGAKKAASDGAAAAGAAASAAAKAAPKPSISLGSMFPEMHVQIPTRVMYINGFKLSRQYLAELVEEPAAAATARGDERARSTIMLIPALLPGVLMTPISSVLEACNAGHANPEHLSRRWIRGLVPRCGREIIFGLGLNNLTDWAEERIPRSVAETKVMRNALGSITAGVIAGYLSHVPHNLSTMKLLDPQTSYRGHVASLVRASSQRVPSALPEGVHAVTSAALALLWPKGLGIRTTQVVGSFVLLNGISHLLDQR